MQDKLKIIMMGPSGSGKTALANSVSGAVTVEETGASRPTQGVRIVEFELADLNIDSQTSRVDVELWDCSGDHMFEACWPAIRSGVSGVILVCSPNTSVMASRELDLLYNYFVSQQKLSPRQCVVFYNTGEQDDVKGLNLSPTFAKISQVPVNVISGGTRLKVDFSNFVTSVIQSINK